MSKHEPGFHHIARKMFARAIAVSAPQLGVKDPAQVLEELRTGQCYDCELVRINLARQVADYLATIDSDLRAVYFYNLEYAAGDYASPHDASSLASAINLIAWTDIKESAPLNAIEALSEAFDRARNDVVCDKASKHCFSLNVSVVGDAQVKERKGYAVIIDSSNVGPIQVWPKGGAVN